MGWIKNKLRTKIGQRRLNMLSLLAIESEIVKELDFGGFSENVYKGKS